ncbi:hypothetical protein B2D07_16945 [Desulfococcus multivorans]|nr:hypothetical protein B2D07_16945 [Desulfococcus multivorans]
MAYLSNRCNWGRPNAAWRLPSRNARALTRITVIVIDTALRLAQVLGMPADFRLGLQQDWDLWHAMNGPGAGTPRPSDSTGSKG